MKNLEVASITQVSDKIENTQEVQPGEETQFGVLHFDLADKTIRRSYSVSVTNMPTPAPESLHSMGTLDCR